MDFGTHNFCTLEFYFWATVFLVNKFAELLIYFLLTNIDNHFNNPKSR